MAQLLEPVYRTRGDYPNLVAVQEVIARHSPTSEQKIAMLAQIAEAYELGLDDPERAYDALGRALREDPLHADVQTHIERHWSSQAFFRRLNTRLPRASVFEQLHGQSDELIAHFYAGSLSMTQELKLRFFSGV